MPSTQQQEQPNIDIHDPINQTTRIAEEYPVDNDCEEPPTGKDAHNRCSDFFQQWFQSIRSSFSKSTNCLCNNVSSMVQALKNPVILVNTIIGATTITTLFVGYTKYDKRFLMGQSNKFIWSTVAGVASGLSLDIYLSKKYYKKG